MPMVPYIQSVEIYNVQPISIEEISAEETPINARLLSKFHLSPLLSSKHIVQSPSSKIKMMHQFQHTLTTGKYSTVDHVNIWAALETLENLQSLTVSFKAKQLGFGYRWAIDSFSLADSLLFNSFMDKCPMLEELTLSNSNITDEVLASLCFGLCKRRSSLTKLGKRYNNQH
jgi:hypothetical protein